jgi:FkbM family methyltransferase
MRALKELIKRAAAARGYELVRLGESLDHPFDVLNLAVRELLSRHPECVFVEIGGGEGIQSDGLYPLVCEHHLQGLVVEPLPEQFTRLQQHYAGEPQVKLENCAIAETAGTRPMFYFERAPAIPDWAYGMASFNKAHLTKFSQTAPLARHIREVQVPTLTFAGLLAKHQLDRIHILSIDTEGYDYEVLKMVCASPLRPEIINYEHEHLSGPDLLASKQLLAAQGYLFIRYGRDILALREEETKGRYRS